MDRVVVLIHEGELDYFESVGAAEEYATQVGLSQYTIIEGQIVTDQE